MSGRGWIQAALLASPFVLISFHHTELAAQSKGATLAGVVVDSAGRPLAGAAVELYGTQLRTLTSAAGTFQLQDLQPTRYWLFVRRIGYYPYQASLTLHNKETREARIVMSARPVELPEVVVNAENKRYQSRMREFLWRSGASFNGRFLTRDDIARSGAIRMGDLVVRYLPFKNLWAMDRPGGWDALRFLDEGDFSAARLSTRRQYRPDCPPAIAVNGGSLTSGWAVNDFDPDEVEALEIYREGSSLPYEYSWGGRADCGVVVVWLKSYAQPSPQQ